MPKSPLSLDQIHKLVAVLRELFKHHSRVRESTELGSLIQYPKIPPALSESIAFHLFHSGALLGKPVEVCLSRSGGDLELLITDGSPVRVEVKATAQSAFQYFGPKDLKADILLWIHFGDLFQNEDEDTFQVYLLERPREHFPDPRKITLNEFLRVAGHDVCIMNFKLASLAEISPPHEAPLSEGAHDD